MKHVVVPALAIATLILGAVDTEAQTTAPGFYFPPPAWNLTVPCPTAANCQRFIMLSNMSGALMDVETGLLWSNLPDSSYRSWSNAQAECTGLALGGRMGWRLPTIAELTSLLDMTLPGNTLPPGGPKWQALGPEVEVWSSTPDPRNSDNAYGLLVPAGKLLSTTKTEAVGNSAFCVRGGLGVNR